MFATLLALTLGAPAIKDKPAPKPTIEGEWQVVSRFDNGAASTDKNRWVFARGGTAEIRESTGGRVVSNLTYTLAPGGQENALDFYEGQGNGKADLRQTLFAIQGDTLTLCFTCGSTPRPTSLDPGTDNFVIVLKRVGK